MKTRNILISGLAFVMWGTAAAGQTPVVKGFVSVNGGYQTTSNDFRNGATFRANAEDARFDSDYTVKAGPAFDVAGGGAIPFSKGSEVNIAPRWWNDGRQCRPWPLG